VKRHRFRLTCLGKSKQGEQNLRARPRRQRPKYIEYATHTHAHIFQLAIINMGESTTQRDYKYSLAPKTDDDNGCCGDDENDEIATHHKSRTSCEEDSRHACYEKWTKTKKHMSPPLTRIPRRKKVRSSAEGEEEANGSPISIFQKLRSPPLEPIMEPIIRTKSTTSSSGKNAMLQQPIPLKANLLSEIMHKQSREEVTDVWKIVSIGAMIGGIGGFFFALGFILLNKLQPISDSIIPQNIIDSGPWFSSFFTNSSNSRQSQMHICLEPACISPHENFIRGRAQRLGTQAYLDLFGNIETTKPTTFSKESHLQKRLNDDVIPNKKSIEEIATTSSQHHRRMTRSKDSPKLVIAGKMSVGGGVCNIAQLNLATSEWSFTKRIQLSLYNSYSGGEVYSLLVNHTSELSLSKASLDHGSPRKIKHSDGSGELIVVGAFDTTYRNNQVTYCSVGKWNGVVLSKVGEGLCNVALSKGMKITTASLAGPQEVYVAGSFQTQVWSGDRHEFVKIYNIAHFNAAEQVWLPLNVGQISCSWCVVTVLALAWDSKRRQLHVAGKFNAIDGRNVPAGLAIYNRDSGHLVAHPGGGLSMINVTQDGVATALQLDQEAGVLYVMGSFERLTKTNEICYGLAAYEINADRWTCLADAAHSVLPTGGGNMLLTPYGLMVAGKTTRKSTTWPDASRPYTIALLKAKLKKHKQNHDKIYNSTNSLHDFNWSWLPGFDGHNQPLHALANGFGDYDGTVFIAGENIVAKWSYQRSTTSLSSSSQPLYVPKTEILSNFDVHGAIMAISQMMPAQDPTKHTASNSASLTIIIYCVAFGTIIGMVMAILCNRNISTKLLSVFAGQAELKGISLDTLTYSAIEDTSITEAYERAMKTRYVEHPHLLTLIDPQEIFLQRIIGEGTFGRVWSARWRSAKVAVKEFVFAQAAVAGKSSMQGQIIEEIIGEAGMMAILRHPNVLQLFGCSLTAQAIWIVSELCSLGSLRQLLDENERILPLGLRVSIALQVAEGMAYLHNQTPPIIHRDLKSHNIFVHETFTACDSDRESELGLLSKKGDSSNKMFRFKVEVDKMETESTILAKIGDWGSARAALSGSRTMTHGVGTACWLAPEVIKHARSSKFSDVYSYGIILWELATREEVYQGLETTQIIAKVANESLRPPVPHDCPWKHIMIRCWEENPLDRLEFNEIVDMFNEVVENLPVDQMTEVNYHASDSDATVDQMAEVNYRSSDANVDQITELDYLGQLAEVNYRSIDAT